MTIARVRTCAMRLPEARSVHLAGLEAIVPFGTLPLCRPSVCQQVIVDRHVSGEKYWVFCSFPALTCNNGGYCRSFNSTNQAGCCCPPGRRGRYLSSRRRTTGSLSPVSRRFHRPHLSVSGDMHNKCHLFQRRCMSSSLRCRLAFILLLM